MRWAAFLGLIIFSLLAWALSENRRSVDKALAIKALLLQAVLAFLVLGVPAWGFSGPLRFLFDGANDVVIAFLAFTNEGSRFVFGSLVDSDKIGFIFAFQVLPTIIFMASIMAVFYHLGVMQKVVKAMALVMQKTLRTSGAESLAVAANVFVGQTEAPLIVKPYVNSMTRSELFAVMVGGMATVAGGVLAAYVGLLKDRIPDIAGHLLTASVLSAPAALMMAKLMLPEMQKAETFGRIPADMSGVHDSNIVEAAARGAGEGLHLALNVGAMLLAFIALIAAADAGFKLLGEWIAFSHWASTVVPEGLQSATPQLSLSLIFGWIFAPFAWLMGIPWNEAAVSGALLGEKVVFNEFVAYLHLSQLSANLSERTIVILSYALCGFANFSSIAIQIGGIGGIAPDRRSDLAKLGLKAVIGGSLAAFMTACFAGILA